jgi:hypothetical protein
LFQTYCAICHGPAPGEEVRAPGRDALKQMTPEHILQVLETGGMKAQGAERVRAQRRALAEYLAGKTNAPPDIIPRSAFLQHASLNCGRTRMEWLGRHHYQHAISNGIGCRFDCGRRPV